MINIQNHRFAFLAAVLVGCTAAKANLQIVAAEQALTHAQSAEAQRLAPFEYQMAVRYYEKAQEEAGHSDYRIADALARQSGEWSDRAVIFLEKRGRAEIGAGTLEEIPDALPEKPPEPEIVPEPKAEEGPDEFPIKGDEEEEDEFPLEEEEEEDEFPLDEDEDEFPLEGPPAPTPPASDPAPTAPLEGPSGSTEVPRVPGVKP